MATYLQMMQPYTRIELMLLKHSTEIVSGLNLDLNLDPSLESLSKVIRSPSRVHCLPY